jgi:hypothetical protein
MMGHSKQKKKKRKKEKKKKRERVMDRHDYVGLISNLYWICVSKRQKSSGS